MSKKTSPQRTINPVTSTTVRFAEPQSRRSHRRNRPQVIVGPDIVHEQVHGFVSFLREHAIVGLAVGFVIGTQVQTLVKQLISSFIDPAFQLFFGQALSTRTFVLHFHSRTASFGWGAFVYGLLDFLFVLVAIYVVIRIFGLDKLDKPKS